MLWLSAVSGSQVSKTSLVGALRRQKVRIDPSEVCGFVDDM